MKKYLSKLSTIVVFVAFVLTTASSATLRVGSCAGATYTTIQTAINNANSGDTIEICTGTYNENLSVSKNNLTIKGIDGQTRNDVVVDGGGSTTITVTGKNETFENFKIKSGGIAIYTKSSSSGTHTYKNLIISSDNKGIYVYTGAKVSCDTLDINSSNKAGIYIRGADGNHTLNNITVNSKNYSIYVGKGGKSFTNLDLNSTDDAGLQVSGTANDLIFSNISVKSKDAGIFTGLHATGKKVFKDINITSGGDGVFIYKGGKVSFEDIDIKDSGGYGVFLEVYAVGNHTFKNIKINSKKSSIVAQKGFSSIDNAKLSSSDGSGISDHTYRDINISNTKIDSKKTGISLSSGNDNVDINISNTKIDSKNTGIYLSSNKDNVDINIKDSIIASTDSSYGIYIKKARHFVADTVRINKAKTGIYAYTNVEDVVIKNSKINNCSNYALFLYPKSPTPIKVNNNCLYGNKLVYSRSSNYNFDDNFWSGVSDVNNDGKISKSDDNTRISTNVVDNAPKCFCSPPFDTWDTFRSLNDRNISTKIVNQNFNLTVVALDENGTNYQEFNGTVCATVDNNTSKLDFRDQNTTIATFNINKGTKDTKVHITWKKNVDESCPLSSCNETNSSDNFAIRPKTFGIDINTTSFYAGVPFHIDINATNFDGENTKDYNETNGTSFVFDINDSNFTCSAGVLGGLPNPLKFNDGNISFDTNYSDVGDINFNVKEINGSEFALIDEDDTNDSQRLISEFSKKITVNPYQFAIFDYNFIRNPEQDWRYMSDINDSNITLTFKIQAQNFLGNITPKFDSKCYSKDVNFTLDLNSTNSDGNISYFQSINNQISYGHDRNLSDFNLTGTINDQNFSDGNSSQIVYALNVYRKYNNPKAPLMISIVEINTTYADANVTNIGLKPDNNASSFYYGRIKTDDVNTNKHTIIHSVDIEVFSSTILSGFKRNSLSWYQMYKDNSTTNINFQAKKDFSMNSTKNDVNISAPNMNKGFMDFNITNSWSNSDSAYIHLKIPKYLWYSRYSAYDDNNSSDCGSHPCFKYNYLQKSSQTSVNITSGDFNGTDIGSDYNASKITKKGVKVFR